MSLVLILNSNQTAETVLSSLSTKTDSMISLSSLVADQLPDFVRQDHTRLVEFLEAYYEWMEQKNETLHSTFVLQNFSDVDTSITDFIKHFKREYLENFPEALAKDGTDAVNEKRLIKRIKEFYKAKGTEKAYRLLFRILHDAVITDFYYPKVDIIKSSGGKWITNKSLKTSFHNKTDIWNSVDKPISQYTGGGLFVASGMVRDIKKYNTKNAVIAELFIDNINGEFNKNRELIFNIGGTTGDFKESIYSVVTNIYPIPASALGATGTTQGGSNYKTGEKIKVLGGTAGGSDAVGEISQVDGRGAIVSVDILNSGIAYKETDTITFDIQTLTGTGAGLTASVGSLTEYPGYYFGSDGQPSSNKRLFDNNFYQQFSYELKTGIALQTYKKEILNLIHPAGTKLFNQMLMKKTHTVTTNYKTNAKKLEISILGHYTPYKWTTSENLRYNSNNIDVYPFGYNPTNALGHEGATQDVYGHTAEGVRSRQWFGQVFNDFDGRTAQSDTVLAGMTYAYGIVGGVTQSVGSVSGGTWSAGVTGPMYQLSEGVFLDSSVYGTAGASAAYDFVGTADAGTFDGGGSYWVIYPHPNARSINNISAGCSFAAVGMQEFFFIEKDAETAGISTGLSYHVDGKSYIV